MRMPMLSSLSLAVITSVGALTAATPLSAQSAGPDADQVAFPENFEQLFVLQPQWDAVLPRNGRIVLAGSSLKNLDGPIALSDVSRWNVVATQNNVPVELILHDGIVRPRGGLWESNAVVDVRFATPFFPEDDCSIQGNCQESVLRFNITDEITNDTPVIEGEITMQFKSQEMELRFDGVNSNYVESFNVYVKVRSSFPKDLSQNFFRIDGGTTGLAGFVNTEVFEGDLVTVAISATSSAGIEGPVRAVRTVVGPVDIPRPLATSFCELSAAPQVHLPQTPMPTNGFLQVDIPFENAALGFADDDGNTVALRGITSTARWELQRTTASLPPNSQLDVVALPCPSCLCATCSEGVGGRIRVGPGPDQIAPSVPTIVDVREETNTPLRAGFCVETGNALVVDIDPGTDDLTAIDYLRYDAAIRIDGSSAISAGRGLVPFTRSDGTTSLRLQTQAFENLLEENLVVELVARDLAQNGSEVATFTATPPEEGCSHVAVQPRGIPWALSFVLLAVFLRRRPGR